MASNAYHIRAKIWLYPGQHAPWHFITLPKKQSDDIKKRFSLVRRGWGSVPVKIEINETNWKTSIFPDKVSGLYLLPLKADVRKKEELIEGDTVAFKLTVLS